MTQIYYFTVSQFFEKFHFPFSPWIVHPAPGKKIFRDFIAHYHIFAEKKIYRRYFSRLKYGPKKYAPESFYFLFAGRIYIYLSPISSISASFFTKRLFFGQQKIVKF